MLKKRFDELEGIRGVAAIVVVIDHFLYSFYALAIAGATLVGTQHIRFENHLYGNPIMVFASGTFAVAIFFILSGFVLSIGFFSTGDMDVVRKLAAKRYLRLMIPAVVSVLLCYLLLTFFGQDKLRAVAAITGSNWLAGIWVFSPNLLEAIKSGVVDIFFVSGNKYNGVLWTMMFEFFGSFLIFGFLAIFGKTKNRFFLYIPLLVVFINTWFLPFVIGMVMADLYAQGKLKAKNIKWPIVTLLVAIALFLGAYPILSPVGTIYQYLTVPGIDINWQMLWLTIGSTALVGIVLCVEQVGSFFASPKVAFLGKYTFSLYLVHLVVLFTFTMAAFLFLYGRLGFGYNVSAILSMLMSIPVVIALTVLFEKYVDAPSIKLSATFSIILLSEKKILNTKK